MAVGAARVDRAFGLDRLAAVEDQRVLAHRDHLGAEPIVASGSSAWIIARWTSSAPKPALSAFSLRLKPGKAT